MASIEVAVLSHNLEEDELSAVQTALAETDIHFELDQEADPRLIEGDLDDDLFVEFLDQLEASDAACDIYVPAEFEDVVVCGDYRIGSAHALRLVLEEMRNDIFEGDEEEEEEEEEEVEDAGDNDVDEDFDDFDDDTPAARYNNEADNDSLALKDDQMRHFWHLMFKGARTCIRESVCLFIHR